MPDASRSGMGATIGTFRQRAADERGAAMVLGLFLALAVIAALWCVIGIGDAIVARDRSQEAADAVAYASAVVHARGMNFISLINIVLLAMTMLYVLLSALDVLLSLVLTVTGINHLSPNWCGTRYLSWLARVTVNWCPVARAVEAIEVPLYKLDRAFFERYKKLATPLFHAQSWAASAVPYLGVAAGLQAGADYDQVGIAYSHSLWPGGGASRRLNFVRPLLNKIPGAVRNIEGNDTNVVQDRRIGLPVDSEAAYNYCIRGTRFVLEWMNTLPGQLSFGGLPWKEWASMQPITSISTLLFQMSGEVTRLFFCRDTEPMDYSRAAVNSAGINVSVLTLRGTFALGLAGLPAGANDKFYFEEDAFWKMSDDVAGRYRDSGLYVGPKRVVVYAYNGNDWMQVWAASRSLDAVEKAAENVSMPARVLGQGAQVQRSPEGPGWLFSGAEFYFDCASVWQSIECNRGSAALYQMNWRARLRRMHWPNAANTAFEMFLDNYLGGPAFKGMVNNVFKRLPVPARDSLNEVLSKEALKLGNGKVFTGDMSIDGYYH